MIKSLVIENFQSHAQSTVEFDPGVNLITGESDCGKTALIRALNWALTNSPSGDGFRSTWGGRTTTKIVFDDGGSIERTKDADDNVYVVNGQELRAFGRGVPDEIPEVSGMNDLNKQFQLDPPFLLSDTAGEVSRYLNQLLDLDDIDTSLSFLGSRVRKARQDLEYKVREKEGLEEQLQAYEGVDDLTEAAEALYHDREGLVRSRNRILRLEQALHDYRVAASVLEETAGLGVLIGEYQSLEEDQKTLAEQGRDLAQKQARAQGLGQVLASIQILERDHDQVQDQIYVLEQGLVRVRAQEQELETLSQYLQDRDSRLKRMRDNVVAARSAEQFLEKASADVEEIEAKLQDLAPDQCPLCGSPWPHQHQ